jgi:DNA-binding response OmpR family regulator
MNTDPEAKKRHDEAKPEHKVALVVADLGVNSFLFQQFNNRGWAVEYVTDNASALSLLTQRPFDLIITSENTSAEDDIDLLSQMRAIRPHTRMIILTGNSTTADVIAALRAGAFSYFSKPYSMEALSGMVRIAIESPYWDDAIEVLSAKPSWIRILVRCDPQTGERMVQFFHEIVDLPEEEKAQVAYAFREMLVNAIRHGAKFDPTQFVEISYVRARHMVGCRVKDPGEGFSLNELYHAAVANPPNDPVRHMLFRDAAGLPPGGYGILLSRHLVDELIYSDKGNDVLLVKYLNEKTEAKLA